MPNEKYQDQIQPIQSFLIGSEHMQLSENQEG
jgi:hypothetical protein